MSTSLTELCAAQVGNQAVTLQFAPPWQGTGVPLSYDAGFTILSLVVSCLSMVLAFSFIGLRIRSPVARARIEDEEETAPDPQSAYDVDAKPDPYSPGQATKTLPQGLPVPELELTARSPSAAPTKRKEKRREENEDEDEDGDDDEFGVGAAKVSASGVVKILIAGIVCGGGIAAMHYIGQVSINSVTRVTNNWYTIFLSVIIAMLCVTIGLYILFVVFRPKLQHSWLKRILVAAILAVGVTLMHFVALLGTHYWVRAGDDLKTGSDTTTKKVISESEALAKCSTASKADRPGDFFYQSRSSAASRPSAASASSFLPMWGSSVRCVSAQRGTE